MSSLLENGFRLRPVSTLTVELPLSKSLFIRELVLQFLNRQPLTAPDQQEAEDIQITYHALSTVYQHLNRANNAFIPIHVGDCGAAFRFLMAVLAITPGHWLLTGSERLLQRPILPLVNALHSIGADIAPTADGWRITGQPLHAQQIRIDGSESSQFISALLLIAKHIGNPVIEYQRSTQPSEPYILMTEALIAQYDQQGNCAIQRDWSAAIFWYALCALGGAQQILLKGLSTSSVQGDAIIAQWFEKFGVSTALTNEGVVIRKEDRVLQYEHQLNLIHHPDLAPVLTTMATMIPIKLTIKGLHNLKHKESERKTNLETSLASLESPDEDTLIIKGSDSGYGSSHIFDSHGDHRLVMAYSLLALKQTVAIAGADCVRKSYPQFAEELKKIMAS